MPVYVIVRGPTGSDGLFKMMPVYVGPGGFNRPGTIDPDEIKMARRWLGAQRRTKSTKVSTDQIQEVYKSRTGRTISIGAWLCAAWQLELTIRPPKGDAANGQLGISKRGLM